MRLLALLGFCLAMVGCAQVPLASNYDGPEELPETLRQSYAQPAFEGRAEEEILKWEGDLLVRRIRLEPVRNLLPEAKEILIDYYHPGGGPRPFILVLPNLGGSTALGDSFATYFARHGYAALLVHRENRADIIEDLDAIETNLRQILIDHRQVLDWAQSRQELDSGNIGIFGISMGGIKGTLVAALDERIKAAALALTGGDLPYLLTRSTEEDVIERRRHYMKEQGLSLRELKARIALQVQTDPLLLAPYIDARKLLMVLAVFDETIPFNKGRELKRRIGNPETIYVFSGHYSAILYKNYIKYKATKFFDRKLIRN